MSGWRNLDDREAWQLRRQLLLELAEGHPLRGRPARAVARRDDCDDVAFQIEGSGLCIVHLAWAPALDPRWPTFEFVQSLPEDDA